MTYYVQVYNDSLKRKRFVAYPGFVDTVTVNGGSPTTFFAVSGATIDSASVLEVHLDGRMATETTHYTRDVANNRIITSTSIHTNSEVRIRVFLK